MAEKEKQMIRNMAAALAVLPDDRKEYFLGFAEGAAAIASLVQLRQPDNAA